MTAGRLASDTWRGFRSVVCAVDFSESSRAALRYAAAIATRFNGHLDVVFANDPFLVAAAGIALHDKNIARRSAGELSRFVSQTLPQKIRTHLRTRTRVSIGRPHEQVLQRAARLHADLIVMGTHGLTGLDRLIVGSTTVGVLRRTRVPVLAVPHIRRSSLDALARWPGPRIAAATMLDARSRRDADVAGRLATAFGASLLLVHVIRGDPADEITAFVTTHRVRLLVTNLRDRSGWFSSPRGAVTYHVLSHAVVPVLACPPQWRPR